MNYSLKKTLGKTHIFNNSKLEPTNFQLMVFIDPSGQNQLYHTSLLLKIWDLPKSNFLVKDLVKEGENKGRFHAKM